MFLLAILYTVAGVANLLVLGVFGLGLFHVAVVAVMSLIAAFGLYRMQSWSLWFVLPLFFIATTYAATLLNAALTSYGSNPNIGDLTGIISLLGYLVFTWFSTAYIAAKRETLG
jgi:hypothetical protein